MTSLDFLFLALGKKKHHLILPGNGRANLQDRKNPEAGSAVDQKHVIDCPPITTHINKAHPHHTVVAETALSIAVSSHSLFYL